MPNPRRAIIGERRLSSAANGAFIGAVLGATIPEALKSGERLMPKRVLPLTDKQIRQAKPPETLIDGNGLRLRIEAGADDETVFRTWVLRVTVKGAGVKEGRFARFPDTSLSGARDIAKAMRDRAKLGIDPFEERAAQIEADREKARAEAARRISFRQCCKDYLAAHKGSWKNAKHREQWEHTLLGTPYPPHEDDEDPPRHGGACGATIDAGKLGDMAVGAITTEHVLAALKPVWMATPETGSRLRGRIEAVLAAAAAKGLRSRENPATWRNNLDKLLPARSRVRAVKHHPALDWREIPAFWAELRERPGIGARALELVVLTAARSGEVRGMRWSEIDLDNAVWTVPASRMKAGREHRVPLSALVVDLLRARHGADPKSALVFTVAAGEPLSDMTLLMALRRMPGRASLTVHGLRSTFRDWCGEETSFPREVIEAALAHTIENKTEAAYRRGDALEKRRKLMEAWARYCASKSAEVVDFARMRKTR
jgi:integrase